MADIALTAAQIAPVFEVKSRFRNYIANVALTRGDIVYMLATGKVGLADANASGLEQVAGVAMDTVGAGTAVTVLEEGEVYGFTIAGLAYGAQVYLSDTAGKLADAASGTKTVVVGRVIPLTTVGALTKILRISTDVTKIW